MLGVDATAPVIHQKDTGAVGPFGQDQLPVGKAAPDDNSGAPEIVMLVPALRHDLREIVNRQWNDRSPATAGAIVTIPVFDNRQ
jgi:hypothetical protein